MNIETGIPIPRRSNGKLKSAETQAMEKMQPGESILVPAEKYHSISTMAHRRFGTGGYALRTTPEGLRLWRLK